LNEKISRQKMGSKIECYVDCVSAYSHFAVKYLVEKRETLREHGVELDFIPVFLGGIMQNSGNQPPWTNIAKGKHGVFDRKRACKQFGVPYIDAPAFFPINSLLPQRCMVVIKEKREQALFEKTFLSLWESLWQNGLDVSQPEILRQTLARNLDTEEIEAALVASKTDAVKKKLTANTQEALDRGAFGAPFFWVTNPHGVAEPFFGSDRFNHMFDFLELPVQHLAILPSERHNTEGRANL